MWVWDENKKLKEKVADLERQLGALSTKDMEIASLRAINKGLEDQLAYVKALLMNKKQSEAPDEDDTTIEHEAKPRQIQPGYKPFSRRKREFERQHAKGSTGRKQSIAVNAAAMLSDPRTPQEKQDG